MHHDTSGLGRVLAQHRGRWMVASDDEEEPRLLPARGSLRETPPVTGDWVTIDSGGAISAVLERRGTLLRRAAGDATAAQVLAANVDLALVVESLPDPNERRAERLAALAVARGPRSCSRNPTSLRTGRRWQRAWRGASAWPTRSP
jgi:ribosome biogenesis GTPase